MSCMRALGGASRRDSTGRLHENPEKASGLGWPRGIGELAGPPHPAPLSSPTPYNLLLSTKVPAQIWKMMGKCLPSLSPVSGDRTSALRRNAGG